MEWYEKALTRFDQLPELREDAAETAFYAIFKLYEEERYFESIVFLNRAIALKPDFVRAYESRGFSFMKLHDYQRAIADLNHSLPTIIEGCLVRVK